MRFLKGHDALEDPDHLSPETYGSVLAFMTGPRIVFAFTALHCRASSPESLKKNNEKKESKEGGVPRL